MSSNSGAGPQPTIRTPRQTSARTRTRILEAALALFNERGTAAVSTNHIAAAAAISPGNLYYHYADKGAIVRALHAEYAAGHDGLWRPSAKSAENVAKLRDNMATGGALAWSYRFLGREVLALLRADRDLRLAYRAGYEHRLGEWLAFGERLVEQGLLRPSRPPQTLRDLTVAIWLIAEGWLPFLDATGDPLDPAQVARGNDLVLAVLDPLLTAKGRRAFQVAGILATSAGTNRPRPASADSADQLTEDHR